MSFSRVTAVAFVAFTLSATAQAQDLGSRSGGLLDGLLGSNTPRTEPTRRTAQVSESDLVLRIERMENHLRQLTGAIEQLQFRNQQLEQALRRLHGEGEDRSRSTGSRVGEVRPGGAQPDRPQAGRSPGPAAPVPPPGRRSDVFDPTLHPDAPGAPRPLGNIPVIAGAEPGMPPDVPPVGIAGGREAGAPLDLTTLLRSSEPAVRTTSPSTTTDPPVAEGLPPPPPRNPSATGAVAAVQPPTQTPDDEYDLAYGYMLRKDFALAEDAFRAFLRRYPRERRVAEATFWLGESMFQRQRYRDAAESFLSVSTKFDQSAKAPDALYRLGQSLAALGEREAACAALGEVGRKYPRASASVRQGVEREQKRGRC